MAPGDRKPNVYADTGCTWTTPDHNPNTRAETKAHKKTHAFECLNNPTLRRRRRAQEWEEANEQSLAEAKLRRINARQEEAATNNPTRRNHPGQETPQKDLPEKDRQGKVPTTKTRRGEPKHQPRVKGLWEAVGDSGHRPTDSQHLHMPPGRLVHLRGRQDHRGDTKNPPRRSGKGRGTNWPQQNSRGGHALEERPRNRHQGAAKGKLPRPRNHRD